MNESIQPSAPGQARDAPAGPVNTVGPAAHAPLAATGPAAADPAAGSAALEAAAEPAAAGPATAHPHAALPDIAQHIPVLYRDAYLAVVNKPAGLMVHDSKLARGEDDFLADRLREQFARPVFLVHRLDRATSGCLLLAFDRDSASALGKALMAGEIDKDYLAICRGWPAQDRFVVDHALDGGPGKPQKKDAVTRFDRLASGELELPSGGFATSRYALLRCRPLTGRFRQIRRHLKHLSHHLIGDTSHGDGRHNRHFRMLGVHRMLLHAERLAFPHPVSGERMAVVAPPDAAFAKAMGLFGWVVEPPAR